MRYVSSSQNNPKWHHEVRMRGAEHSRAPGEPPRLILTSFNAYINLHSVFASSTPTSRGTFNLALGSGSLL